MAKKSKCEAALNPSSMEWCEGVAVIPGIRRRCYYIPKSYIVKWPKLPSKLADGETMGTLAVYQGDFVLAEGKYWSYIDILEDKSPATSEVQGEKPSKTFLNKVSMVTPHTDEEAAGFSRIANNSDYVYLPQQKDGKFRVIGNQMFSTETSPGLNLGTGADSSDAGMTIEVQCTDLCHLPFYAGVITTEDGDANAPEVEEPEGE